MSMRLSSFYKIRCLWTKQGADREAQKEETKQIQLDEAPEQD